MSLCHAPGVSAGAGFIWDPAGGEGDLDADASWLGGVAPEATDSAIFSTPGGTTTARLDLSTFTVAGISIQSGDTVFDLGSNHTFSAGAIELGLTGDPASMDLQSGDIFSHSILAGDGVGTADVALNVAGGTELTVVGSLAAMSDVGVTLDGGVLSVGSLDLDNAISFLSGTLTVDADLSWDDLGSPASLTLGASHDLTATGLFSADAGDVLTLDGGSLWVGSLDLADAIDFVSGTLVVDDDLSWDDLGSPASLTLGASHALTATGLFSYDAGDTLTLDGGSLTAHALVGTGVLDYVSGALSVGTGIDIGSDKDITSSVTLLAGDSWHSDGTISIDPGFGLTLDGGFVGGDTVDVQAGAVFTLDSGSADLETLDSDGSVVLNGGMLTLMYYNSTPGASLAINGPAFIRLTQQDLRLNPGADWGDNLALADDSTLQAYNKTLIGTDGPATLSLGADAVFQTSELVLGPQATINLDPTASLQANTVTNEDTLTVEGYLDLGVQPWSAPIVTLNNRGTLTYNTPGTAVAPVDLVGNGAVHVMDGTLVLDRTDAGDTETLTHNILTIDAGAELVLRDDRSPPGSPSIDRLTLETGASPSLVNSGLLTLDHISVQLLSPYTGSGAVHLTESSRFRIAGGMSLTFHDLTAESSSSFYRTDFDNGTIELTVLRSTALSTFFSEPINVTFVEDVTVDSDGIGVEGDLTNLGILRLADGSEVAGQSVGPTNSNRLNAPGATILLGDGSRFVPRGSFQNFGTVAVVGTGTGTVGVTSLTGNGVFDAGAGRLEVNVGSNGTWSGQFLGGAGSALLIDINNSLLTLTSAGLVDTDGDLTFTSGGATTVVAAPLRVAGLLTIGEDDIVEVADSATAFDIGDLAMTDDAVLRITSGQDVSVGSLTILESGAENPGRINIETSGQFDIGAGGILNDGYFVFSGGGTMSIAGPLHEMNEFGVDGARVELGASLTQSWGDNIALNNGGEFVLLAGHTITGLDTSGTTGGGLLINHGTLVTDAGPSRSWGELENHGMIRVVAGSGLTLGGSGFLLTGTLLGEAGGSIHSRNIEQTATGVFEAHGTVRLFDHNRFGGTVDLTGATLEMIGETLTFDPGAQVVTLGNAVIFNPLTIDGQSGAPIVFDDLQLLGSLDTTVASPDAVHVRGRLTSLSNRAILMPTIVSGTIAPGTTPGQNHFQLRISQELTLQTGAAVELDFNSATQFDRLFVLGDVNVEDGVALHLESPFDTAVPYTEGMSFRLIHATGAFDGAFDTVTGLDHGNGLQWRLTYDADGLLAEVGVAGDVDGDGWVGVADLDMLLAEWDSEVAAGTGADLSGDGLVGDLDLGVVLANWGAGTPAGPDVPEPGTLLLLAGGALLVHRRRRPVPNCL